MKESEQNTPIKTDSLYKSEHIKRALDSHAIVSIADVRGNIIHVNDKFCDISGYSREELLGQNHRIVKSGNHSAKFYKEMWLTIANGDIWHGELCNKRKDGTHYWVASTITPLLDDNRKPYQYVSIRTDITAVKNSEAALKKSETDLLATLEATADGILAIDEHCNVSFANKQFYDMWEIPDELQGTNVDDKQLIESVLDMLVDPDAFCKKVEALYQSDESSIDMLEMRDGRIIERSSHPLLRENKPVGRVWGFHDITHRIQDKKDIERYKERLRLGQLFANIGTWEWNIQTGDLYWTERIAPLFGYTEGDVETSYDNFLAAVHPEDKQAVIDAVNACVEDDVPYDIEHRVVWQDGSVRWLMERGAVVRDKDGTPLHMTGVVQDIDDKKRAELALSESDRQLRQAQSIAKIGSWEANVLTGELTWSDEIFRIFGYEPGSFRPSVKAFHAAVHPDDRDKVNKSEAISKQTGKHDVVHRIILPDGSVRHVHELAHSELNEAGELARLVGTVQDVTETVENQAAVVKARDEAERANKAKSEFLSSMSHELRTPLNAILGFGQLIQGDDSLDEYHKESVDEIINAGYHLLELINEVLDLSRVESGKIDLSLEPVEICPVVDECLSLIGPLADKREITISHTGVKGAVMRADRTRLKQALLNLLSNAIKYNNRKGSVTLNMQLSDENQVRILISDTGNGIAEDKLNELFEPFHRLGAEKSNIEGTGIGLTLTRRLVEMMGGSIGVDSTPGKGSTFWIELPIETISEPTVHEAKSFDSSDNNTALQAGKRSSDKHTILYIEDNPANLKLVTKLLSRRKNIHLITAHIPSLGIELASTRRPDLILLDINLPEMDGYEVLDVFQNTPSLKDTPIVAITANAMPADIQRGMDAGFSDYITKPIAMNRFLGVIDNYLDDIL